MLLTPSQTRMESAFAKVGVAGRSGRAIFLWLSGLPRNQKWQVHKLIGDGDGQGDSKVNPTLRKSSLRASKYRHGSDLYEHLFVTRGKLEQQVSYFEIMGR
jgi:hypothetical protein